MTLLSNRTKMMLLTALVCLFAAGTAAAQANPANCTNDIQCVATPTCGGEVCDWSDVSNHVCKAAGSAAKGSDGWCTTTDDCKCKDLGATCVGVYCSFTRPCDAPDAGGCPTGGTAGTSGTSGGDGGGCSVATGPTGGMATLLVSIGLLVFSRRRRR
jgi:MYXO-CTERM domain-containing protein